MLWMLRPRGQTNNQNRSKEPVMHIGKKTLLTITGLLCSLGIMTAAALALESTDEWKPANTAIKIQSKNSSFTAAGATATCANFAFTGTTPKGSGGKFTEAEAQAGISTTPKVEKCNPSTTEVKGTWTQVIHSNGKGFEGQCSVGKEPEDDDCITTTIPNEGAVIKFPLCTSVKVNAQSITGVYNDEEGIIEFKELPVKVATNCIGEATAKFKGTFKVFPIITDDV
jgi:hypothetical protein